MIDERAARRLVGDIFGISPRNILPAVTGPLEYVLSTLRERERFVLELRYGLNDGAPRRLDEVATLIGVTSRERPRQIQAKALRRLRHATRNRTLKQYIADTPIELEAEIKDGGGRNMPRGRPRGMTDRDKEFLGLLIGHGRQNPKPTGEIMMDFGVDSPMSVYVRVARLRDFGHPIYNEGDGYFLDGALAVTRHMKRRFNTIVTMVKRTVPVKVEAERMIQAGEQLALPEPDQTDMVDLTQRISGLEQAIVSEEAS